MSKDQSLQAQLKDAIARGDKDAIKALMRQGGMSGLLQTMRAVQAAAASGQALQASTEADIKLPVAVSNALKQGNLIEAVKRLRDANPGMSLKAAKDYAEAMGAAIPRPHAHAASSTVANSRGRTPTVVMGDKPGSLRWVFVLIAFAVLAWWWSTT